MSKYRHAKVAPSKGMKFSTMAVFGLMLVVGAVGAKALTSSSSTDSVTAPVSQSASANECSAAISGYSCRLDAAIEASTR